MNVSYKIKTVLACLITFSMGVVLADTQVNVVGLFKGKALVMVNNGKPQTLSVGQTSGEVKLIASDSQTATFQIEGKRRTLSMGQAASVAGAVGAIASVTLYANGGGHHEGEAIINGSPLKYVVDTGATTVAMNSGDAKYAHIDYTKGEPMQASTANGLVSGYRVMLSSVKLGGITLNNVEAAVLEGGFPQEVLLGNSALTRLDMKREGIALTLTKKY